MTINYHIRDSGRRHRLPFGVPLEDIFPGDDVHPHLKAIFIRAYQEIVSSKHPLSDILEKSQGSMAQRLQIVTAVSECKQMPILVPPGVILWVIRHFLGLLPIPLLPTYTDDKYYSWHHLATFCKDLFLKYNIVDVNNALLTAKIAKDLLRLPAPHLILFVFLIHFIRLVTSRKDSKNRLNRLSAYYMVKYFSSSLFLRPYIPGRISKLDKRYFPLLLYIVLRWPEIENLFKRKSQLRTSRELEIPEELLNTKKIHQMIAKKYVDNFTQTETEIRRVLSPISESFPEIRFRHVDVQTDDETSNRFCDVGVNYELPEISSIASEEISLSKMCYTQSTISVETLAEKMEDFRESTPIEAKDIGCNTDYAIKILKRTHSNTNTEKESISSSSREDEYIYDSYDSLTLALLSNGKPEKEKVNKEVFKRVSKMGWTYTPPKYDPKTQTDDDYKLCFESKEVLNDEAKEKSSLESTPKDSKDVKVKRSSFSISSIRSKLVFLRKFTPRNRLKGCNSSEEFSNIKYKKIAAKKSTTF